MFQKLWSQFDATWNRKSNKNKRVTVGICAMNKKANSKPMRAILDRLAKKELFDIVIFGDDCILHQPVDVWPVVEVLIAFYSTNFPTEKALEYVKLRKPFMVNDLEMEATLKDRRLVYRMLESQGIDVPKHVFLERDDPSKPAELEEFDEYIVVNGVTINKPLVEKPVDAEDHNIYIYYPASAGGGTKKLFRKVNNKSSDFYPALSELRKEGSFIYEEFVITQGTDVKVYTVGPEYGHAEARKSPVVDGRVKRDSDGLEVRYPVILSPNEKLMAHKIVTAFRQTVCGFDILRVKGKSYCCDVNGFSFVKNSRKYYDDCAEILCDMMWSSARPDIKQPGPGGKALPTTTLSKAMLDSLGGHGSSVHGHEKYLQQLQQAYDRGDADTESECASQADNRSRAATTVTPKEKNTEELRCVIAVCRHGDRTPKQKLKIKVDQKQFLDYFSSFVKNPRKDLKVKSKAGLLKFLDVTREVLDQVDERGKPVEIDPDLKRKLTHIREVLERWKISGINRKLQMKPQKWAAVDNSCVSRGSSCGPHGTPVVIHEDSNNGNATPTSQFSETVGAAEVCTELLLILKWGGDLTPLGREQAIHLGENFRHQFYPDKEGGGVLRLHSTYRHDLKIKASDEGRVMKTAAAFTKGLLELEGQLTPILASLVTIEEKNRLLLDRNGNYEVINDMQRCKDNLNLLQTDEFMSEDLIQKLAPDCNDAMKESLMKLGNPLQSLKKLHDMLGSHCDQLREILDLQEQEEAAEAAQKATLVVNDPSAATTAAAAAGSTAGESFVLPTTTTTATAEAAGATSVSASSSSSSAKLLSVIDPAVRCTDSSGTNSNSNSNGGLKGNVDGSSSPIPSSPKLDDDTDAATYIAATGDEEILVDLGLATPAKDRKTKLPKRAMTANKSDSSMTTIQSTTGSADDLTRLAGTNDADNKGLESTDSAASSTSVLAPPSPFPLTVHDGTGTVDADAKRAADIAAGIAEIESDAYHHGGFYLEESIGLMVDRWEKLYKDFYDKKAKKYDLTKVPDVYDMMRYDALHNSTILKALGVTGMQDIYNLVDLLENVVVPQEYGIDGANKRYIGSKMCRSLLEKIRYDMAAVAKLSDHNNGDMHYMLDHSHAEDLQINSLERRVRTRLYFTSESHLQTLLNVLRYSGGEEVVVPDHSSLLKFSGKPVLGAKPDTSTALAAVSEYSDFAAEVVVVDQQQQTAPAATSSYGSAAGATTDGHTKKSILPCMLDATGLEHLKHVDELSYLTQIVFRLFENVSGDISKPPFRVEISLSPGAVNNPWTGSSDSSIAPYITLNKSIDYDLVDLSLDAAIELSQTAAPATPPPTPALIASPTKAEANRVAAATMAATAAAIVSGLDAVPVVGAENDAVANGSDTCASVPFSAAALKSMSLTAEAAPTTAPTTSTTSSSASGTNTKPPGINNAGGAGTGTGAGKGVKAPTAVVDSPTATSDEWEKQDAQMASSPAHLPRGMSRKISSMGGNQMAPAAAAARAANGTTTTAAIAIAKATDTKPAEVVKESTAK